ncbi:MAG TPA: class I SAM-dependent methyltransferase, partial [Caldilineaceae bacterium]|nr:class I SAM-dependent methyltransferase [Caldilineaceae bacterium]
MRCRICGNIAGNQTYQAREMMLGLRERFDYVHCAACGCLQIAHFPSDMTPYYPPAYFGQAPSRRTSPSPIPAWAYTMFDMLEMRQALAARPDAPPAQVLAQRALARYLPELAALSGPERLRLRILDVGCGDGGLLAALASLGFTNLLGVDRYYESDEYESHDSPTDAQGVQIVRGALEELEQVIEGQTWDLVMMHHAFEHMADPVATLRAVARRLAPGGLCLLRLPVVPSAAWEQYGVNWVQLDAPRHFFLHSVQSLTLVAEQAGLRLQRCLYDSTSFQFVGSELYRRNIPLRVARPDRLFSPQ